MRSLALLFVVAALLTSTLEPAFADPPAHVELPDPSGLALGLLKFRDPGTSAGISRGDFNGDGFADLAVGVPREDLLKTQQDAGVVIVIYGSADGLVAASATRPAQLWHQDVFSVVDAAEPGDFFGAALASGKFNGDAFSDLAVGVPGEKGPAGNRVGGVHVLYGSANGLTTTGNTLILANSLSTAGFPVFPASAFSLVWGDFNGDGFGDLGAEAQNSTGQALLQVYFGSAGGLGATVSQSLNFGRNSGNLQQLGLIHDLVFSAGDINQDGRFDAVVGMPLATVGTVVAAGQVKVLFGSATGLSFTGQQTFHQNTTAVADAAELQDHFGEAVAVGNFNGDLHPDVAVGVPLEDVDLFLGESGILTNEYVNAGVVHVLFGSAGGLTATGSQYFFGLANLGGGDRDPEPSDLIGSALAAGDFDDNGFADLAIGMPGETLSGAANAGAVSVLYGSATGLNGPLATSSQFWNETSTGIGGTIRAGDRFGAVLSAWNFGRNQLIFVEGLPPFDITAADLAIGVPFKEVTAVVNGVNVSITDAGIVRVLYGSINRLSATAATNTFADQLWHQNTNGVPDSVEANDRFGEVLY